MNGEKVLIVGNHDEELRDKFTGFREIWDSKQIMIGKQKFYLNHYAARVWPASHYGSINLYGHSHGNLPAVGKQMDVGVDTNNYFPYSIDQIMEHFKDYKDARIA
jgi:calcineurin-like phosphoesterase family protein